MMLRSSIRLAWAEHGTWAILWTSFALGVLVAWPPTWRTACAFAGLSLLAAAKVLLAPARQGRLPHAVMVTLGTLAGLGILPLLLTAPLPLFALGMLAAPFAGLYAWEAADPKWTRALGVAEPVDVYKGETDEEESAGDVWDALRVDR